MKAYHIIFYFQKSKGALENYCPPQEQCLAWPDQIDNFTKPSVNFRVAILRCKVCLPPDSKLGSFFVTPWILVDMLDVALDARKKCPTCKFWTFFYFLDHVAHIKIVLKNVRGRQSFARPHRPKGSHFFFQNVLVCPESLFFKMSLKVR